MEAPARPRGVVSVSPAEAFGLLEAGAAVFVDVREAWERAQGRIADDLHVPMMAVPDRLHELPSDRTVVVYCHSGVRSLHVARALVAGGFLDVLNLAGGIAAWHAEGLPVAIGPPAADSSPAE